jgi:hypothetical protein
MAFPTSPTNGQTATVNGVLYTYNSTLTAWTVGPEPGANLSGNNINVTSSAAVGTTLTVTGATTLSSTLGVTGATTLSNTLSVVGTTTATNKTTISYDGGANLTNADSMFEILDNGATSTPSMAFHRPTLFATKITLNTDNALYFGGYSAAAGGQTIVSGTHNPGATNTYDLGTASLRWRNIFTQDLQLNNGIGDYTIVEGEDDLFLYNNKKGRVYKFALIEVDPATAPPKAKTD